MKNKIFILSLFLIIGFVQFSKAQPDGPPPPPCGCYSSNDYAILTLLTPSDSEIIKTQFPLFSWKDSTNILCDLKYYQIWINGAFAKDSISLSDTSLTLTMPLTDGSYDWSVSVIDNSGNRVANSKLKYFFIDTHPPAKFTLISPVKGDTSTDCVVEFVWHPSSFSTGLLTSYKFNISGLPSVSVAATDTILDYPYDIPDGTYRWFVTAYDLAGNTTNSDTLKFTKNGKINMIWGYVEYDNNFNTKLSYVALSLLNFSNNVIATTTTDKNGYYKFDNIGNGSYSIRAETDEAVGGIDPTDALMINRNYIKLNQFTDDLKRAAADVNADKKINPIDALQVNRYYIRLLSGFAAGRWLFEGGNFITNCDITLQVNIRAVCVGDVNGSYRPK